MNHRQRVQAAVRFEQCAEPHQIRMLEARGQSKLPFEPEQCFAAQISEQLERDGASV